MLLVPAIFPMGSHRITHYFAKVLLGVLMLCVAVSASAQSITNVARASWSNNGLARSVNSNAVTFNVTPLSPITIETFHAMANASTTLAITPSLCGGQPVPIGAATAALSTLTPISPTDHFRIGELLIFSVQAPLANIDPNTVDSATVIITSSSGDREFLVVYETATNSGLFSGAMPTSAIPPSPTSGDCRLSVKYGDAITIEFLKSGLTGVNASTRVDILADPYGLVFDSEDGTPVNGAKVTLVVAATGAPAQVLADDGVTRYPSVVYTGSLVTDSAGRTTQMLPGEYRFPLTALGTYRIVVETPNPYTAPSKATTAQLAGLTRPDGQPLLIFGASYGAPFTLTSPDAIRVDVPVDSPGLTVSLSKSVSRANAAPGDVVFYTVTARNADPLHFKRKVTLLDTPSRWLRLRKDSVRLDGVANPMAVSPAADGSSMTINLGDMAPGDVHTVTYAMAVRADAPPGQAINRAVTTDSRSNTSVTSAALRITRETLAGRMTLIGQITAGDCMLRGNRLGIAGVRVMLEDGSFGITDGDGRYHFEGLTPGTHVVQVAEQTLPGEGHFVDCSASTRNAGSATSRFVIGQGGSLIVADFHAVVALKAPPAIAAHVDLITEQKAAGGETEWVAIGDGPTDWLFPAIDHNPRAPAIRVVIRHRPGQTVELSIDGKLVDKISSDGVRTAPSGSYAVSIWRGIPLDDEVTHLRAVVRNADGSIATTLTRDAHFSASPAKAELLIDKSHLVADGATRPVLAVRIVDRNGRPVHAGLAGEVAISAPYESAQALDAMQSRALSGLNRAAPTWVVKGDDGIAYVELAPTMVSGSFHLDFTFGDGDKVRRRQTIDGWVVPGEQKWTLVGLVEGSVGSKSVADNMERSGNFDSDLGEKARLAFYAKGRVLGKYLLTVAYDSAKQRDDQRLLGAIDPNAYYTVFADGSDRRFDAASQKKLYVRIESGKFYALFGDFQTGFDQSQLARYNRTTTGFKAEGQFGGLHVQGFAAKIASSHRRDEIQGGGISGPYRLSSRAIIANSELVTIELRDRFRSEVIIERKPLTRFIDYDIDMLSGTISFKQPILSRDVGQNPQFIVVDYEIDQLSGGKLNAGLRADWTTRNGRLRFGASAITDQGDGDRTNLGGIDLRAKLSDKTEIRAEAAASRTNGITSKAWLFEAEHHDGNLDVLAYARSADAEFGLGQINGAERGRRKFGVDTRYALSEAISVSGNVWYDDSLRDASHREALQLRADLRRGKTDGRIALTTFRDRLADGRSANSTVLEGGGTQRFLDNRLEIDASTSIALGKSESIDLPARHRFSARYAITRDVKVIGTYEIAKGERVNARTALAGFEVTPWSGAKLVTSLGQQSISELGKRSFAAFGLAQSLSVTSHLTIDATLDSNRTLGGGINPANVVNLAQPVASGGNLGDSGAIAEDFTSVTLGGTWRVNAWSVIMRGELRDGALANRKGITFGAIRQLGEGSVVGSGFTWTKATSADGATSEVFDGAISAAHRPSNSALAFLTKIEFRSDKVTGAVAGEVGPAGRTVITVSGDAKSRRLIGSVSANWSPDGKDYGRLVHRSEIGVFAAIRHNFDSYQGFDLAGTTLLGGLDARIGVGKHVEVGAVATIRANLSDHSASFAFGPQIGISPTKDVLLTMGYNIKGFRDRDFAAARTTDKGFYATLRMKLDADTFGFLGLGR